MELCRPRDLPDAGGGMCCLGAAVHGAAGCTCWEPIYDLDQQELKVGPAALCDTMCADCAYRPGSPERRGDPRMIADETALLALTVTGDPFFCHQGIRRVERFEHRPDGCSAEACAEILAADSQVRVAVAEVGPGAYDPPIVDGVPYRADGQPAALCAGWMKRTSAEHIDHRVLAAIGGGERRG